MPWADAGALTAGEIAAFAASKPAFIGNNVCENYNATAQWRVSGSWASGTDISDNTNYPTWWGHDRQAHAVTRPTASLNGQTEVFYIMNLDAGSDQKDTFDSFTIINHNLATIGNINVSLQIASNNTFTSNLFTLGTCSSITTNARLGNYQLTDGTTDYIRPFNVQYMRLRIFKTTGTFSSTDQPQFGELWVGRRNQMAFTPRTPWASDQTESDVVDYIADGGQRVRYVKSRGRSIFQIGTHSYGADPTYSITQTTQLALWWQQCDYGSKPSLFVKSVPTAGKGNTVYMVMPEPGFYQPLIGPFERETSITLTECAPYVSQET